jgi:hypothetical protein
MFQESYFNKDISNWNIRNIENMNYMFYNCIILEEYKPIKKIFKRTM